MVARAHDVVDLQFLNVGFTAVGTDPPAALIVLAIALEHRIVSAGWFVEEGIGAGEVFYDFGGLEAVERPGHSGLGISLGDLSVALGAEVRIYVLVRVDR